MSSQRAPLGDITHRWNNGATISPNNKRINENAHNISNTTNNAELSVQSSNSSFGTKRIRATIPCIPQYESKTDLILAKLVQLAPEQQIQLLKPHLSTLLNSTLNTSHSSTFYNSLL